MMYSDSHKENKKTITERLITNPSCLDLPEGKNQLFEQYKLLLDSAHKIEERRLNTNNIFMLINSVFASVLTKFIPLPDTKIESLLILSILLVIGMLLSSDWLKTMESYKKVNYINYTLIKELEKYFPADVFSLRAEMTVESDDPKERANSILRREKMLPIAFIIIYLLYFVITLFTLWAKLII